ncbi:MAG: hypothetical protein PHC62_06990 [Candidatus Izemoplasmatales bacterium]|nr:hypothetical protein [Candidatus Izemoplasmatales bacterium]
MLKITDSLVSHTLWEIEKDSYNLKEAIADGSNFMIGNGYLGYRGTFAEDNIDDYQGCIVTDTWDKADNKWEELCNVPNALFLKLHYRSNPINLKDDLIDFQRKLDMRYAITSRYVTKMIDDEIVLSLYEEKFASYKKKNLVMMKYVITSSVDVTLDVESGIDILTWNINGTHLQNHELYATNKGIGVTSSTFLYHDTVVVFESSSLPNLNDELIITHEIHLRSNEPFIIYKTMIVTSSNEDSNPKEKVKQIVDSLESYNDELNAHKKEWDNIWNQFDITIKGDNLAQVGYRFNTYHAIIATPTHKNLPIGARGLSCQAYQGSAFWDQEIYNLPMYLYASPDYAKHLLSYRYDTLDGARRKAKNNGFEGAFYAWISGKTGDELCPDFFFKDVITDRKIRNHFNLWQIHISPDIAYSIKKYYDVTNDREFLLNKGLEMLFEITRFLCSRVYYLPSKDRYEIIRVQGPDEYHENVDNNAFTNYQSYNAFKWALEVKNDFSIEEITSVYKKINVTPKELELWEDIYKKLYLPKPNANQVIEQFDNYFTLESIVPASDVTKRLIHEEEYYGWPNGIAVFTQCLKQSDVLQLFHLYPHLYSNEIMKANFNYYEPRTLHFSSLSPSIHSIIASRIKDKEKARDYFYKSLSIDLMNTNEAVSGGTFIGGMHTAANAAAWQMIVHGFAGFSYEFDTLYLNPFFYDELKELSFKLCIKNQHLTFTITKNDIFVINSTKTLKLPIMIGNTKYELHDKLLVSLRGENND